MFIRAKITTACFLTSVMGAVSFLPTAFAASSSLYSVTAVTDNDSLNIRSAAGTNSEVVGKIPFDGANIELTGKTEKIGTTVWLNIKWKDKEGWVSKHYLKQIISEDKSSDVALAAENEKPAINKVEEKVATKAVTKIKKSDEKPEELVVDEVKEKTNSAKDKNVAVVTKAKIKAKKGEWVLQCGDKKPYWKVEIHPKWLRVEKGDYETGLPITMKKQNKNRWNTALKTIVKGQQGSNKLEMTIKYAYSKRCYDTLSSLVVPYKVTTVFNGEELTGCCRAVQLMNDPDEQQLSQAD